MRLRLRLGRRELIHTSSAGLLLMLFFGIGSSTIPFYTILTAPLQGGGLALCPALVTVIACANVAANVAGLALVGFLERRPGLFGRGRGLPLLFLIHGACVMLMAASIAHFTNASSSAAQRIDPALASITAAATLASLQFACGIVGSSATAIATALILEQLRGDDHLYPRLRVAGTVGYITAGLAIGVSPAPTSTVPLWLAGATFFALALYCTRLPARAIRRAAPVAVRSARDRMVVFRRCGFGLLTVVLAGTAIARFFEIMINPYLVAFPGIAHASATQMLALTAEIGLLLAMPAVAASRHRGYLLILGPAAWMLLYGALGFSSWSGATWPIYLGLPLQGFNCTFGTAATIWTHSRAAEGTRATTQGIVQLIQGLGALVGTLAVGIAAAGLSPHDNMGGWGHLWLVAACSAAAVTMLTVCVLRRSDRPDSLAQARRPELSNHRDALDFVEAQSAR